MNDARDKLTQFENQLLYTLLYRSEKYSFLPELLDIVGADKMRSLLQLFAGMSITFPSEIELRRQAAAVCIYLRLKKHEETKRADVLRDLASYYAMSEENVMKLFKSVEQTVKEIGFRL